MRYQQTIKIHQRIEQVPWLIRSRGGLHRCARRRNRSIHSDHFPDRRRASRTPSRHPSRANRQGLAVRPSFAVNAWQRRVPSVTNDGTLQLNGAYTCRGIVVPNLVDAGRAPLDIGAIRQFSFLLPPIPERERIISEVETVLARVDALCGTQAHTAKATSAILPTVLDRAFRLDL